jgi:hypothetical protein
MGYTSNLRTIPVRRSRNPTIRRTDPLSTRAARLLFGDLDGSIVDALDNVVGVLAVHGASDGLGRAEDLLDGTGKSLGERVVGELSGNL